LASVGGLLRRYHDAVVSFRPPTWAKWKSTSIPTTGALVCHNDLYPGNVVFRNGRAVGIIDFDLAHPADPLWDLAMAAWHWVPLSEGSLGGHIPTSEWPSRLRLFVDAYGVPPTQRKDVLRIAVDLNRRMRDKRAKNDEATDVFDRSLDALDREWDALVDRLS
jgi:thiamine kinase-like enzyme